MLAISNGIDNLYLAPAASLALLKLALVLLKWRFMLTQSFEISKNPCFGNLTFEAA